METSRPMAAIAASFWAAVSALHADPIPSAASRARALGPSRAGRERGRSRGGGCGGESPALMPDRSAGARPRAGRRRAPASRSGSTSRAPAPCCGHCMRHRYGSHFHQFGDLLHPSDGGPFPVAVLVHGGYWREQHTLELSDDLARDLSRRGWAAWNVEFRRVGEVSGGGYPTTLADVAAAIDFLSGLDAPLDLDRVVAIGHSAGGPPAPWGAARSDAAVRLAVVVSQAGVHDLREADRLGLGEGATAPFVGGTADDPPPAVGAGSRAGGGPQ